MESRGKRTAGTKRKAESEPPSQEDEDTTGKCFETQQKLQRIAADTSRLATLAQGDLGGLPLKILKKLLNASRTASKRVDEAVIQKKQQAIEAQVAEDHGALFLPPGEASGNFSSLAPDVLIRILRELDALDLARLSLVSTPFATVLSRPDAWRRFNMGSRGRYLSQGEHSLNYKSLGGINKLLPVFASPRMRQIEAIKLPSGTSLCNTYFTQLSAALPALTELDFSDAKGVKAETLLDLTKAFGRLKSLSVCSPIWSYQQHAFQSLGQGHGFVKLLCDAVKANKDLESFSFKSTFYSYELSDSLLEALGSCPNLTTVNLHEGSYGKSAHLPHGHSHITQGALMKLVESCKSLRTLVLHNITNVKNSIDPEKDRARGRDGSAFRTAVEAIRPGCEINLSSVPYRHDRDEGAGGGGGGGMAAFFMVGYEAGMHWGEDYGSGEEY